MKEYEVTGLDAEGYEVSRAIEVTLKDAKRRARYLVSKDFARLSGMNDLFKSEVRALNKPQEVIFDVFKESGK